MSDKAAGWYPDPDGENRQRYWDGSSWTEYYTPLAAQEAELHGATTAVADYPYLTASRSGPHQDLMAAPVQVGRGGGWPTAPADGGDGQTQEFVGGKRSSASTWALVAASALVVMLVVGIGWWALGGGEPTDDPTATDTPPPTDGETVTGELSVGASTSATVPVGGLWVGTLTLASDTTILIDARGERSSDDLRISIVTEGSDDEVGGNDDRGNFLASAGGNALNPLAVETLPAGTYEVRVDERNGAEVDLDISVTEASATLTSGTAVDLSVPAGGLWSGVLTVTDAGAYSIDVTSRSSSDNDSPDPMVVVVGETDRQYVNDDRNADDRDPLLEQDLAAGTWVVLVLDYYGDSMDGSVTATAAS